jgi:hypothetical protein
MVIARRAGGKGKGWKEGRKEGWKEGRKEGRWVGRWDGRVGRWEEGRRWLEQAGAGKCGALLLSLRIVDFSGQIRPTSSSMNFQFKYARV